MVSPTVNMLHSSLILLIFLSSLSHSSVTITVQEEETPVISQDNYIHKFFTAIGSSITNLIGYGPEHIDQALMIKK